MYLRIFYGLFFLMLFACSSGMNYVNKKFQNGEYQIVIEVLTQYLKQEKNSDKIGLYSYYIAQSYRLSNRIEEAVYYYKEAIDRKYDEATLSYYYASALKANGRYDEAEKQYQYYLREGADINLLSLARNEVKNLINIKKIAANPSDFKIYNCEKLNTEDAEFSPVFYRDMLVFASDRRKESIYTATGKGYLDFYYFQFEDFKSCQGEVYPFDEILNVGEVHEASPAFSNDLTSMVFARNLIPDKMTLKEVDLFMSTYDEGNWQQPEKLSLSMEEYWDACPALSSDNKTLYFASNRPGGYGGLDLYLSKKNRNNVFQRAVNMGGKINSKGNEMFPFASKNKKLYYASDGMTGLGRLDIFVAEIKNKKIIVKNMGPSINSIADDFGLIFISHDKGFFTSDRKTNNAKGDDDIYYFEKVTKDKKIVTYFLAGTVTDFNDANHINGAHVKLTTSKGILVEEAFSNDKGRFGFETQIEIGKEYILLTEKEDYAPHKEVYETIDKFITEEELIQKVTRVVLEVEIKLFKDILQDINVGEEINLYIFYDLDDYTIRSDAAEILDRLVEILSSRPDLKIELGAHTDTRASYTYNLRLSNRRARAAVDYIISKGISKDRIVAKGYGEIQPIVIDAVTEEEHQRNRRTSIKVID